MADLRRILRRRRAADLTVDTLIDVVAEFGGAVGDSVGKDYNFANSRAEKFLRGYMAERVGMINATTRKAVNRALASDDPAGEVRRVFQQARKQRAKMIAETEVVRASNFAAVDAGKWVKILDTKRWASQQDPMVRHEHVGLHGQTVPWNEKFTSPGGFTGPGPGSMSGGGAMNINCRCSAVPIHKDAVEHFDGDPVEVYDGLREPFIKQMTRAWQRVFDEQETIALAELGLFGVAETISAVATIGAGAAALLEAKRREKDEEEAEAEAEKDAKR